MSRLFSKGETQKIKIWSAGCAAGEEPLSIVIALSDAGWFERLEIEISASDANEAAIVKARSGLYDHARLEPLSPETRSKYFIDAPHGSKARPELHERISWYVANLRNENEIAALAAAHVVFCRNVFIYFSESKPWGCSRSICRPAGTCLRTKVIISTP
jgi:chemotaxis protein methyltransferase CheR